MKVPLVPMDGMSLPLCPMAVMRVTKLNSHFSDEILSPGGMGNPEHTGITW